MVDTTHLRNMAHRQLTRLGGRSGIIVRDSMEFSCFFAVVDYSTREIGNGELISPIDRKLVMSYFQPNGTTPLGTLPDPETDFIVAFIRGTTTHDRAYTLRARPKLYEPHGDLVLIEQQCRDRDA